MLKVTVLSGFTTVDGVCGPIWADAEMESAREANAGRKNLVFMRDHIYAIKLLKKSVRMQGNALQSVKNAYACTNLN
jgi:hypothetical protein